MNRFSILYLGILWLLLGCRYQFLAPNSTLPHQMKSVFVPVFFNKTAEANVEVAFTDAMRSELAKSQLLSDASAQGTLVGTVESIGSSPFIAAPGFPPTSMARATVSIRLQSAVGELRFFSVSGEEEYPPGPDILLTERNRARAIERLAQKLMREAMERLAL